MPCQPTDPSTPPFGTRIVIADEIDLIDSAPNPCEALMALEETIATHATDECGTQVEFIRSHPPSSDWQDLMQMMNLAFSREEFIRETTAAPWYQVDWKEPEASEAKTEGRTLSYAERLFMLSDAGRLEYELRWLQANNATVHRCYRECRLAKLSETTAAEYALICLAREHEDLQRGLPATS